MPIRIRLALWYSVILGAVIAGFGAALYVLMDQHLQNMVIDSVEDRAVHLNSTILALNGSIAPGEPIRIPALGSFESPDVYVQVADAAGSVIGRSSNLRDALLPPASPGGRTVLERVKLGGNSLQQVAMPITLNGETEGLIQVASTFRQRDLVLGRLRWILYIGGAVAVSAAGLVTAALAGRALRPVAEMTDTADAIALARGFDQRLQGDRRRDELGRLARTFNNMLQSLEEAYSAQQRFTADASHELRAPLTAIRGNLDVLARVESMPEDEQRQVLDLARSEVDRLSRLTNDLLSLARADAGQTLRLEPVELDAVLIEAHRQGLTLARGRSVTIDSIVPVVVTGDRDRLKELIVILLDNAIKYTDGDGEVSVGLSADGPWATIAVTDNGIGIDEADIPHVFDRFWRADPARSKDSGGTGLGLSIARWIVDHHGGEIHVKSRSGKGTEVTVRIPVERRATGSFSRQRRSQFSGEGGDSQA